MTARKAIWLGARTVSRAKRLILVLWIFLTLLAALATTPVAAAISKSLGHSKWAAELIRGLDPSWIMETYRDTHGYVLAAMPVMLGLSLLAALLAHLLIAGGAISVFASQDRRYTAALFFEGCGRYFWRFFRLLLASSLLLGIVLGINAGLKALETRLWGEGMIETPIFYASRVRLALLLFLLVAAGMVADYAKIRLVVEPGRSAIRALLWSMRFAARNFGRCLRIWVVLMLAGALFYFVYDRISRAIPQTSSPGVFLLLIAQQLYIMSRLWLRLTFWASQTEMYFGLKPPAPASAPELFVWPPEPRAVLAEPALTMPQADEEAAGPA